MQSARRLLDQAIRFPLKLIPKSAMVPILSGPNRGMKWKIGAGPHSCWLGSYEGHKPRQFAELVRPGDCVFDIGSNAGYYTLLAARVVGATGRVFAFEPLPKNVRLLQTHLQRNRVNNVTIIPCAVADQDGTARFTTGANHLMGRLTEAGELEVPTIAIDGLLERGGAPPPRVIKIDVEGAEAAVLIGAANTIARYRPVIVLAGHGEVAQRRCEEILQSFGYRVDLDSSSGDNGNYESIALPLMPESGQKG